jgi:hypothetical protein
MASASVFGSGVMSTYQYAEGCRFESCGSRYLFMLCTLIFFDCLPHGCFIVMECSVCLVLPIYRQEPVRKADIESASLTVPNDVRFLSMGMMELAFVDRTGGQERSCIVDGRGDIVVVEPY